MEDWTCACDEGFILSESDLGDPKVAKRIICKQKHFFKDPSCIPDPCVALACDTATSECSRISDTEAVCSCLTGFRAVNGETNVCEDIDECSEGAHNCPIVTTACVNNAGSFECGKPILSIFFTLYLFDALIVICYIIIYIFIILNSLYIKKYKHKNIILPDSSFKALFLYQFQLIYFYTL